MKSGIWITILGISTQVTLLVWHFITLQHYISQLLNQINCGQTVEDITNIGEVNSVRKIEVYLVVFRLSKFEIHVSSFFHRS